jgi:hypothetical protein
MYASLKDYILEVPFA